MRLERRGGARRLILCGHNAHDRRAARAVGLLALFALCAPAPWTGTARAATSVYVGNINGANVSQFTIGLGGVLAPISPATVAAAEHPGAIAISPDARSVYVADFGAKSVSQYGVGASGALTPKSPPSVETGAEPSALAVSPDGQSVYVTDAGSEAVSQYSVGAGGALVPMSPAMVSTGERPDSIAVSPDGRSVYVGNSLSNSVTEYNVSASGTLAPKSPESVTVSRANGIAVSPDGRSVYVLLGTANEVAQFDVAAGGALTPKSPPTVAAGSNPFRIVVSPDGKSAYVANEDYSVSQYDIGAGGMLAPKTPPSFSPGVGLAALVISPDGRSAYFADSPKEMISQDDIGAGGILTPKSPPTVAGEKFPAAIAVTPDQGPIASFSARASPAGSPSAFDGSASSDADGSVARFDWSFGDGTSAANAGARPTHTYAAPGSYTVTLQVTDNAGCSAAELFTGQTAYCNVSPGAIESATTSVAAAQSVASPPPRVTAARQSASIWREGNKLAQISRRKRPPVGTTFSFSLNERASVSFSFTQRVRGRTVGHRCLAQTNKNRHRRACLRTITAGTLALTGHNGTNKVVFQGRLSRTKKLKAGRYTLIIVATNSAGVRSAPASLTFAIVR